MKVPSTRAWHQQETLSHNLPAHPPTSRPHATLPADISAAFPSVAKAAKHRRRSLSDAGDAWASRAAAAAAAAATEAPESAAAAAARKANGSSLGNYWSDPLPLPASAARPAATAVEDDMLDTAASPASSDGGCCSPCAGMEGMDRCCSSPTPPAFSPLRELLGHGMECHLWHTCGAHSVLLCHKGSDCCAVLKHAALSWAVLPSCSGHAAARAAHGRQPRLRLPGNHSQGGCLPGL